MTETRSTCPYCGVGCGVLIESDGLRITGVRGDPEHPANFGRLCTKGSTLHLTATAEITRQTRLLHPMQRPVRGGPAQRIGWDAAMALAVDRFADVIERNGPDAVGFYLSGQLLTEDYAVFNKLAKGLIGTNNVDTNSRLCMSSAVTGYKLTLGADAPPCSYEDLALADTVFIVGSNMAWAHPILFRRLEDAKRARPSMRIVVADPRRTETAEFADLYLPILPGSDVALFQGLLHVLLHEGLTDAAYIAAHTNGFDAVRERALSFTPRDAARLCGIEEAALLQAARWFGQQDRPGGATLSLYCQGLNQSRAGTMKNAALVNLHLATGQIGKPGAGPFSLTGQPNAMGGREAGGMATLLPGHREIGHAAHRAEVERIWGLDVAGRRLPATPGKTAVELFEAAADGAVKALWIACTNPAQSMPDQATVRRALERAEFVVVQEAYATTATCAAADLLLPATSWGEKTGTVTNSERRISRVRPAVAPPGEARHDWAIALDFARRLEARLAPGAPSVFGYDGAEAVWNEHRETTRGRDLDIGGLDWARLERGPVQWPCPPGADDGAVRLYADGRFPTPDGRARFVDAAYEAPAEPRDARYPFALTTGRLRDQWHGMSRTGTLGRLFGHVPEPVVELHPSELARLALREGDLVRLQSRRGELVLPVEASASVAAGQAYVAMHWGPEFVGGRAGDGRSMPGVNGLTSPAVCPLSKQPELKYAAVRLAPAALPWRLLAVAWLPDGEALSVRRELAELLDAFGYAACVPFGRERQGLLFRAAAAEAPPEALLLRIEQALGLAGAEVLRYEDRGRGQRRRLRLAPAAGGAGGGQRVEGFLLAGDTSAEAWLKGLLQEELPAEAYGRLLLLPSATPPIATASRGRQVCTCFNVGEAEIERGLLQCKGTADERLAALQGQLRCGTNCGSCLPELRRLVRLQVQAA